jgi:hypothetical protein
LVVAQRLVVVCQVCALILIPAPPTAHRQQPHCRKLTVPTIDGVSEVVVPPCTQNGDVLQMRGKGIEDHRGRGRGDQLVKIRCGVVLVCLFGGLA